MFLELMYMVLKLEREKDAIKIFLDESGKNAFFQIDNITYDANDFEKIKNIIMQQNCLDPIDTTISKEVRDKMLEAEKYKMQQNMTKVCSLEEQMVCVLISTALKLDDIYNLTIRKFSKILQRVDHKLHYQIYLNAQMSGMVKFEGENKLKHWMSDLTKTDRFADVKMDMSEMQRKIDIK
jgi:F0F1-type ATP synthase alpha subunit